jgi:hypothetical protein
LYICGIVMLQRIIFLLFISFFINLYSQDNDSIQKETKKLDIKKNQKFYSPKKAGLLSLVVPGAGQIYNRRYVKAPIVWAALSTFGYFYIQNNSKYQEARTSFVSLIDTISSNNIPFNGSTNLAEVTAFKNNYRSNRDLFLILGVVFYGLQIVDAVVDAHLMEFNVNDNLSLRIQPAVITSQQNLTLGGGIQMQWDLAKNKKKLNHYN